MAETFYGSWLIDVTGKDAAYAQRIVISGSDRADGIYAADVSTPRLFVTGLEWILTTEWNDNVSSGWQPSRMRRQPVNFTVQDGLVVVLGVDDNWPQYADGDFDDIVLRCQNIDPDLIPWHPFVQKIDFSLPKRGDKGDGRHGERPCGHDDKIDRRRLSLGRRDG
jgi:hypothetical protein